METKLLEIRDRATFIPILAIRPTAEGPADDYLLARAGYAGEYGPILLVRISGGSGQSTCDPYDWGDRTFQTAHAYIAEHFDELHPGSVVDVEFILGETASRKVSERLE